MAIEQGLIDLSARAVFRLSGSDRVRYLNGQVSNDVTRVSPDNTIEACVCNLKGKLDGVVFISDSSDGEAFWIDAPAELRESLFARLSRYIIADDCELEDITGELALVHAVGEPSLDLPGANWRNANRFGPVGFDLWVTPDSLGRVLESGGSMDPEAVEEMRILHGIPKWDAELTEEVLPAEAGLDRRAIDFQKGCYLGQEVVSRIESVGRVNRVLSLVACRDPEAKLEAGQEIFPEAGENVKAAGRIGSAVFSREWGRFVGLAILKGDVSGAESELVTRAGNDKMAVRLETRKFKNQGL